MTLTGPPVSPIGSLDLPGVCPGGDQVKALANNQTSPMAAMVRFDSTTRTIIDGRTAGFCKLIVDRATYRVSGRPR